MKFEWSDSENEFLHKVYESYYSDPVYGRKHAGQVSRFIKRLIRKVEALEKRQGDFWSLAEKSEKEVEAWPEWKKIALESTLLVSTLSKDEEWRNDNPIPKLSEVVSSNPILEMYHLVRAAVKAKEFWVLDGLCSKVNTLEYDIAVLTATFPYKDSLNLRNDLYVSVFNRIEALGNNPHDILKGLGPSRVTPRDFENLEKVSKEVNKIDNKTKALRKKLGL
jgi:hypothetical protein